MEGNGLVVKTVGLSRRSLVVVHSKLYHRLKYMTLGELINHSVSSSPSVKLQLTYLTGLLL